MYQQTLNNNPEIYVGIISFNGRNVIEGCINSILEQTYTNHHIHLINIASTDGTGDFVRERFPEVEVIEYPENKGPSPGRNLALKEASCSLVLLVDDDAVLSKNCLQELVEAYRKYPHGAVWAPRIVYFDRKDTIQYEGTNIYYLAEAIVLNADAPVEKGCREIKPIQAASGVCLLIAKEAAAHIGYFDEDYFFGRTDGEFTFRLTQAGYALYVVPKATCYHKAKVRGFSKVFYQVRNRWYLILTSYAWRTIILILPALFVYEFLLIPFLAAKGRLGDYLKAMIQVVTNMSFILEKRYLVQSHKKIQDKFLLHGGDFNMRSDLLANPVFAFLKTLINKFFNLYWKLVYPFV